MYFFLIFKADQPQLGNYRGQNNSAQCANCKPFLEKRELKLPINQLSLMIK